MIDLGRYHVVSDRDGTFPWTKYERLLKMREIFEPQWEDGVPTDPELIVPTPSFSPHKYTWLVMEDSKAWGFILNCVRGKYWVDTHLGFRPGLPGLVKKAAGLWVLHRLFADYGYRKVSAFVPEFNVPARIFARAMGFRMEGYVSESVWRNGQAYGSFLYGVTRHECLVWTEQFRSKCSADPPVESEWRPDIGGERPH